MKALKKTIQAVAVLFCVVLFCFYIGTQTADAAYGENLVKNGGGEEGTQVFIEYDGEQYFQAFQCDNPWKVLRDGVPLVYTLDNFNYFRVLKSGEGFFKSDDGYTPFSFQPCVTDAAIEAYQGIDVSEYAEKIDKQGATATVSAYMAKLLTASIGYIKVDMLTTTDGAIISSQSFGLDDAGWSNTDDPDWLYYYRTINNEINIPKGTRNIRISMKAQLSTGSDQDVVEFEDISLILNSVPGINNISPADQGTIKPDQNLTITFDENVTANSGIIKINKLKDDGGYETPESIDVTGSKVKIQANIVTLDPSISLPDGNYYVYIPSNAFIGSTTNKGNVCINQDSDPPITQWWNFTVKSGPAVAKPDLTDASDTGSSKVDNYTNNTKPTFIGTADSGSTVTVYIDSEPVMTIPPDSFTGSWEYNCSTALAEGTHNITATATDEWGTKTSSLEIIIDTTPPATPAAPDVKATSDTGASDTDDYTNDTTPTISGKGAEVGSIITLFRGGSFVVTGAAIDSGDWSCDSSAITDGNYTFTVTATDKAGNENTTPSLGLDVTIDTFTTPPAITAITGGKGISDSDFITNNDTFTISGTAEKNSNVKIQVGDVDKDTISADESGQWSYNYTATGETTTFTAIATDTAGNTNTSKDYTVKVDKTAPTVESIKLVNTSPTNSNTITYHVTFSETVVGIDVSDFSQKSISNFVQGQIKSVSSDSGKEVDVVVDSISGNGKTWINLNSDSNIKDIAGNLISEGFTGESCTIDTISPFVKSIKRPTAVNEITSSSSITFQVEFSEAVTGVDVSDFLLNKTPDVSGNIASVSSSGGISIDVTVNSVAGDGTIGLDLKAPESTGITDTAGNAISAGFNTGEKYDVDTIAPSVVSINRLNPTSEKVKASSVTFRVTFSENVEGIGINDFALVTSGTSFSTSIDSISISGAAVDVTINITTGDGSINLNLKDGGTGITDLWGNPIAGGHNCDQAYNIDNTAPAVSSVSVPAGGYYKQDAELPFTVNFNENVVISGSGLKLDIDVGGVTRQATYKSCSESSITFGYTVLSGDNDSDGITVSKLTLNGTQITDAVGNDLIPTLNNKGDTSGVFIDSTRPTVSSVNMPADDTYLEGEMLEFTLTYSENVTVSGINPTLGIEIGDVKKTASLKSVVGYNITFEYEVQSGDNDEDGITVEGINSNGGAITDTAGNIATTLSSIGASWIKVDAVAPTVLSVDVPESKTYIPGDKMSFTVNFSENISGGAIGTPTLQLTLDSGTVSADYSQTSGSAVIFNYTVGTGDTTNGITIGAIQSGTQIEDYAGNSADLTLKHIQPTSGIKIDSKRPTVTSVTVPAAKSYKAGDELNFTVNFDENINVSGSGIKLGLTIGASNKEAGLDSSSANSLTFRYTVQPGDTDADGISVGAISLGGTTLKDEAGNTANITLKDIGVTTGVIVDTTAPTVNTVSVPGKGTYKEDGILTFTVNLSEDVNVTGSGLTLGVKIGANTRNAQYSSESSSSDKLVFKYTVQAGEYANGIEVGTITLNSSTITDTAGNIAQLALNGVGPTTEVLVDAIVPEITSITLPANKTYKEGDILEFKVNFSENVNVDNSDITLGLNIGGVSKNATYTSKDTNNITLAYTISDGDNDIDGITLGAITLSNTTTIKDATGNNADITIKGAGSTAGIKVDTVVPTITSVSVPANKAYKAGDELDFTVHFSENLTVSGMDIKLGLDVGGVAKLATYKSKTANSITFSYTVEAGDTDADGISVGALTLNTTTLRDIADNDATPALNGIESTAGVTVDTTAPTVVSVSVPGAKIYKTGEKLGFTVNFSEGINLSGSGLTLDIGIGEATKHVAYKSTTASGITFEYIVQSGDNAAGGITVGAIALNGATIKDIAGNNAKTALSGVGSTAGVIVDTTEPTVKAVSVPGNKTYKAGETLSFTVQFNENVTVTGIDAELGLQIGKDARSALFNSSADDSIIFNYTVQTGDNAPNGITIGAITLHASTIVDIAGNDANIVLSGVASTSGIKVDALAPAITKVEVPDGKLYKKGDTLSFTLDFSEKVTVTGTPELQLQLGSGLVNAAYVSSDGSSALVFDYTIKQGDNSNGITVSSIQLGSSSIKDAIGNDATLTLNNVEPTNGIRIDTVAPQVTSVTVPAAKRYKAGDVLNFTVNFGENINVSGSGIKLGLTIGASNKDATLDSSSANSLTFKYTVQQGDTDADGISVGAISLGGTTLKDAAGNSADTALNNIDSASGVIIDTTAPTVKTVSVPGIGIYKEDDILTFTVNLSEDVNVTGSSLTLGVKIGANTRNAQYSSESSSSDKLVFKYTVQAGELDTNGIEVGTITLNSTAITDTAGNIAQLTLNGVEPTTKVQVDAIVPEITSVTLPANKTYKAGNTLEFKVDFSEDVNVDKSDITLGLNIGGVSKNATYKSKDTNNITFTYTISDGDNDIDGITLGAITLNNTTIKDATGNNADITIKGAGSTAGIKVDTVAPTITSVSVPANKAYKAGDELDFTVHFSENLTVSGMDIKLGLDVGGVAKLATYKSKTANSITFSYTVEAGDTDADGISVGALTLNSTTLKDIADNDATPALNGIESTAGVTVDTTAPTVESVSVPGAGPYKEGDTLSFTVNLSEKVNVSGSGLTLGIKIGGETKQASYQTKKDDSITFSYVVTSGDNAAGGITVGAITLNGTTIKDIAGNSAATALNNVGDMTGIIIDTVAPVVTSVSTPQNKAYKVGDELDFTVNFNENIQVSGSGITLGIGIGNSTKQAGVKSISPSGITFSYSVQSGDNDVNGITLGAISLNGASVKDNAGNTANLTLNNVSTLGGIIVDTTGPAFSAASIPPSDAYIDITFNEGVYGASDGVTALTRGALKLIFTQNGGLATNVSISAIAKSDKEAEASATPLSGGESVVRVFFKITGSLRSGVETIQIMPANQNSIFDKLGNAMNAAQSTAVQKLHDNRPHDTPSSGSNNNTPPPQPPVQPKTETKPVIVEVNGVVQKDVGSANVKTENNVVLTTIVVDEKKLEEKLKEEGKNTVVTIPVTDKSDVITGELTGKSIKDMEKKDAVLEIKTDNVSYVLPATEINIDDVSKEIGKQVELKDIKVSVKIADSNPQTATIVQSTANKENYEIVVKPVDFEITCSSSDDSKVVSVSKFNSYVERTVAIPDGVDPKKITTGVVLNNDGTFSHVPTTVFKGTDDRYYAKINSLTNSTYTVIWNPITFKDVENHWAKQYVNNVGSRLIDDGVGNGNFAPDRAITRSEFASMIVKALGLKASALPGKFSDVNKKSKYYNYIYAAYEYGIITGYTNGKFGPDDLITRQDAMTMISRAMKIAGLSNTVAQDDINKILKGFTDSANISSYAKQASAACVKNGLFSGNKGKLTPNDNYTRAESAVVIIRLLRQAKLIEED